jgi:hypothetical protein
LDVNFSVPGDAHPGCAVAAANRYYKENTKKLKVVDDSIEFKATANHVAMQASGRSYIETPFLNLIGYPKVPLFKAAESTISEAAVAAGGNGDGEVEISMMLDIVLIQETRKSRIALVPFSEAINIEPNWAAEVISNGPQRVRVGNRDYYLDPQCAIERTGPDAFTHAPPTHGIKYGSNRRRAPRPTARSRA